MQAIVQAMMQHASGGTGQRESTDVNSLVSEHIDLAYHGKRVRTPGFTCEIERALGAEVGVVEIVPQEIGRVLLNLLGNAFDAVGESGIAGRGDAGTPAQARGRQRGRGDGTPDPSGPRRGVQLNALDAPPRATVTITTRRTDAGIEIRVADNRPGIPEDIKEKIFEPFFTTKPTGTGTELGLSLAYDIVTQGHGGTLTVENTEGEGATFVVILPVDEAS